MKPTVAFLNSLPAKDTRTEALWRIRLSRNGRAGRPLSYNRESQSKLRKQARRQKPHGWKGGAK